MDRLQTILLVLLGSVFFNYYVSFGSVLEVKHGGNITLYCNCKKSTGIYIVWFRNCSHYNQPSLVLDLKRHENSQEHPRYKLVANVSSDSYDLFIMNMSASDEGFYYCGTVERRANEQKIYRYSNNTTRVTVVLDLHPDMNGTRQDCGWCWKLLFSLCPAVSVVSALLSSLLVYRLFQKTAMNPQEDEKRQNTRSQTGRDEDVCYAALEIRQTSQRSKRKRTTQSSEFSTYSAIKTSAV